MKSLRAHHDWEYLLFYASRGQRLLGGASPTEKKSPFFEKGRFRVPSSKKLTFSDYYVNKTHKHLK